MENTKNFKCECGGYVVKLEDGYQCDTCSLKVYNKFMKHKLSQDQIQNLFYGEEIEFNNIKSKDGYMVNATLYLNDMEFSF